METWIEVDVRVPEGLEELAAEALLAAPLTGLELAPGRLRSYFLAVNDSEAVRAGMLARVAAAVERSGLGRACDVDATFKTMKPIDWNVVWRESLRPFRVGPFAVVPHDFAGTVRPTDVVLKLEPGGSYGTGRHPSTRFALRYLARSLRPGDRVLDAGSGSGILAVAAARLGAREALGFDVDPNAVPSGEELAERNGVAQRCRFVCGDFGVLAAADTAFDVVLANLHADLLQAHAGDLAARMRKGGALIASGIRVEEDERTRLAFAAAGITVHATMRGRKWMAMSGTRS
ncbi:MAG: 50S ribosomal protein L11 methyltransferase [Planctomycetes bacterium]|nr:50S ribosomal protein L11 methyltransferase [Planctomycetota bacterium]MCC7173323.1 50S ribosomal protein L11 methyltransferase [Planctomycetota bacterium]